jgi:hypothetical protein
VREPAVSLRDLLVLQRYVRATNNRNLETTRGCEIFVARSFFQQSSRRGCHAASSPLIKPDVRISRIRLTQQFSVIGIHRTGEEFEIEQAEAMQMGNKPFVRRDFITTLTATTQVSPESLQHITV